MEEFWTKNPEILYKEYTKVLPNKNMTIIETLNTLTRLSIYIFLITYILNINANITIVSLLMVVLIIIYYEIYIRNDNNIIKENNKEREKFTDIKTYNNINDNPINMLYDIDDNKDNNIELQSGYIDFDGEHHINKCYADINLNDYLKEQDNIKKNNLSYDKHKYYIDKFGRKPSINKPFRNITMNDYLIKDKSLPINADDNKLFDDKNENELNKKGDIIFNSSVYRNIEDVFARENSQRIFMTQPIKQLPNSQTDFANWLYKRNQTCKENNEYCTYHELPNMQSSR